MEKIEVTFTIEEKPYVALMHTFTQRRQMIILGVSSIAFFVLYILILHKGWHWWILMTLLMGLFVWISSRRAITQSYRSNPGLQAPLTYTFSTANIEVRSGEYQGAYEWNAFREVRELKDWFVLQQAGIMVNPVPKKDISPEQQVALRELFKEKGLYLNA